MRGKVSVFLLVGLILIFSFAQGYEEKAKVDLKKVADNYLKAVNSGDAAAVARLYTEDAIMIMPGEPEPIRGRKAIEENQAALFRALPDFKVEFTLILISGDHITFEGVGRGTFTGPLASPEGEIPPTGRSVALKFVFIAKVTQEGLVEEDRTYFDTAEFMKQLGLME
jgi:steroid delta-isomerase-like uncharacterized protein